MKPVSISSTLIRLHQMCFLFCVIIIFTISNSVGIKHNESEIAYTIKRPSSINSSEKSEITLHPREQNKIYGNRNDSMIISYEENSTALDRFHEDVQKAQKNFKWIGHIARYINNKDHLSGPAVHINKYIAGSINTADVLGRSDIGYKSRLRGKRSFDRNYETMWMSERNKYREDSHDVPQRVYLDNDMTFKRNADSDMLHRFHSVLDRAVYGSGAMNDQPLRDIGNKDLHFRDDWSNSNGNPKVTYGEGPWIPDYRPTREILINSDDDLLDQSSGERLYDRIYADDLIALRESPSAINNAKRQNTLSSLEALKKTVLKLREKLSFENKKENMISSKDDTDNWDNLQSEMSNFRRRNLDYNSDGKVMRLKRMKNTDEKKNKDLGIFQGLSDEEMKSFEDSNSKKLHDRSKRSRSFVDNINNRTNLSITSISENIAHSKPEIIKNDIRNVIKDRENNESNSMNVLNKTFELKYPSNKRSSLNDHFVKLIVMPLMINETIRRNIRYIGMNCINSSSLKNNLSTLNTSIDLTCFFTNNDTDTVRILMADRTDGKDKAKKLEVLMREILRFGMDDGQLKGAREEIPLGNTSCSVFDLARNKLRNSTVETSAKSEIRIDTGKENHKPMIPRIMKLSMMQGNPYQKQETQTLVELSQQMSKDGIPVERMTTNESGNANVKSESLTIDLIDDEPTAKPKTVSMCETMNAFVTDKTVMPNDRHDEFNLTVLDESRKQKMLSAKKRNRIKSNGDFSIDKTTIRSLCSNRSEITNLKKDIQIITSDVNRSVNNIKRRLLWMSTISVDPETEDLLQTTTKRAIYFNNFITSASPVLRVKPEIITGASSMPQNTLNSIVHDINLHARYKRSSEDLEDLEFNNEADRESEATGEDEAINHAENQRNNEEYPNENMEESMKTYEDGEEDMMEGITLICKSNVYCELLENVAFPATESDRLIENAREERSLSNQKIDPIKAIVNTLIQQRHNHKDCSNNDYARKRRNTLDMIEYYDYDGDEQEERDAPVNDNAFKTKIKRDDKARVCKLSKLGKKKNENAETAMKEERDKANNTEPKEEIIVDLDKSKSKITKNKKLYDSSESSFEDAVNEEKERSLIGKDSERIDQREDVSKIYHEESATDLKSKWTNKELGNRMVSIEYSAPKQLEDNYKAKVISDKPLEYVSNTRVDSSPDIIEDTVVNIQPNELQEQNRDIVSAKSYEDLANKRFEDCDYYQTKDQSMSNDADLLYEELKKVYDWPDGELKSGPRLRGDQRLCYESDDKPDTGSSQLQSLDDIFIVSNRKDDTQTQFRDESSTIIGDIPKGSFEQTISEKKDLLNGLSISTTTELIIFKIVEDKNNTYKDTGESTIKQSAINTRNSIKTNSGSPYENRKYIESELRQMLKRDLKPEKETAIKSQDLYESFVEPLNWHDDFDDNVKARFGRGLKTITEALISESNKSNNQISHNTEYLAQREMISPKESPKIIFLTNLTDKDPSKKSTDFYLENKSIRNITNINFPSNSHNNDSSGLQHWSDNTTLDLMNIFNMHRDAVDKNTEKFQELSPMNGIILNITGDLEAAEQKYINYQTPRIKRTTTSYYDDIDQDQRDSDEADISLDNHLQFPHILANQPDRTYHSYVNPTWNIDVRDNLSDGYSKISRNIGSRKKGNFVRKNKKSKQSARIAKMHMRKNSSHIFLNNERNRRHHAYQVKSKNSGDREIKRKNKTVVLSATRRTDSGQKSKMADRKSLLEGITKSSGEKVFYENAEDQSTVKSEENDTRKKEITSLLAIDNIEDESQIDMALHGELAGKIVEQIFEQVQKNSKLKNVIGPGLYRNYKMKDIKADEIYRQGFAANTTNHTETLMKRVTELLDELILNEIQRKTCISLSPDMHEFLGWILEVDREEESLDEAPPLPAIRKEVIPDEGSAGNYLFDTISKLKGEESIQDLQKKVRILETLVDDYNALTAQEKTKVQTDHNYLVGQLNGLLRNIEALETAQRERKSVSMHSGTARSITNEDILQYQRGAATNAINTSYSAIKEAFFSPIDTHRLLPFNNKIFKLTDGPSRDAYISPHHRGIRSLDDVSSKHRRRNKQQHRKKNENHSKRRRMFDKHRKYQNHARSSKYEMLRQKRANLEDSNQSSLYSMYEVPTIYDSFDILDAKLIKRRQKRKIKRELADKKNDENDRMLDSLPIKGKNRLEDEVILLNKREAWKRENQEQLEAVAFGKDMRNGTKRERERFEKLTKGDKRRSIDNMSFRMKREGINLETSTIMDHLNDSGSAFVEINNRELQKYLESKDNSEDTVNEKKLKLVEKSINVYADNNPDVIDTDADGRAREISKGKKLAINAGTDNRVREELRTTNYERKIDKANVVNLTNSSESLVSKERRKVFRMEKETDDKVVKLNPETSYRDDETDLEMELENLRDERRDKRISSVTDWQTVPMTNSIYNDYNLPGNRSRKAHFTLMLDELGDLDINLENNSDLLRLRKNRQTDDIIGWRMMPIIRKSVYVSPLSEVILEGKEMPATSDVKDINLDTGNVYSSYPIDIRRLKHHKRRNRVIDISPIFRIIGKHRRFRKIIYGKENRLSNATSLKNPNILRESRKLSRSRSNQESNGVTESGMAFVLKESNRELYKRSRYTNDPTIYNEIHSRPIWLYQYYDDFTNLPIFHIVPDIVERNGEIYRYPMYLEYDPFKERTHDLNWKSAKWNGLHSTILEEAVNFPRDNLTNSSSEYRFDRGKSHKEMEMSTVATHEDNFATKCTRRNKSSNIVSKLDESLNDKNI